MAQMQANMGQIPEEVLKEQQEALRLMEDEKSLLLTGPGGTGKKHIIRNFVERNKHIKNIAVTSTTGTSAVLIKGRTLSTSY